MLILKHITSKHALPGTPEGISMHPLPVGYTVYPIDNHVLDGREVYHKDTRYLVQFLDTKNEQQTIIVSCNDDAYILNNEGKTIYTIHRHITQGDKLIKASGKSK